MSCFARVTSSSATVLDHITTNENRHEIIPSVIDYDITDHYPVMAIINRNVTSNPSQPIFIRSFNKFNSSNFINDLQLRLENFFPQMNTITKNNINDVFDEFYSLITKTISNHVPLKKLSRKQKRLKSNPWMTKGLITSIKKKQKMHKTHFVQGTSVNKLYYKKYSNILTRLKDLAKKFYYHHKLNECKDSPTQTWKILRSLLPSKNNNLIPDSITVNSSSISDLNQIAEEFNNHFANVGKSLANSLKDNNTNDESIYLKHPCPTSIFLQPTTPLEIMVLINSLKLNKAKSHNDIDPYFLKIAAPILAFPLSVFLNHCLTFGTFPNRLKLAKVVPVFKKGLTDQLSNYRPISLLPSLSKLFERIIHSRLLSFFEYNNTIVTTQYGFRHNRSTIHPILDLITSCFDNINNKKYSTLLFLDIKKVFDSVSHKKLIKKIRTLWYTWCSQ